MTRNSASLAQIFVLITALSPAVSAFLLLLCIFLRRAHYGDQEYFSQASVASRYSVFRLAGCFILLLLSGVTLRKGNVEDRLVRLSLLTSYIYSVLLALLLSVNIGPIHKTISRHLEILLSLCFILYAYRDLWPLAISTMAPVDVSEGWVLWFKITALAIVGVVLPLVEPSCTNATTPEEAASLFSKLTYGFLEPLILLAYRRKGRLSLSELPGLVTSDTAAHLVQRSFLVLDSQSQYLLGGLLKVFRHESGALAVLYLLQTILTLAIPLGLNRLLNSVEVASTIHPWFWIAWILFGFIFRTVISERYTYIATRTMIHVEAILTQLIVQQSLRIRTNFESTTSSSRSMGKLMNLATSDLASITATVDVWLVLLYAPVQIVLSTWLLYAILGWSAIVGLAVMVACLPLPAYLTLRIMRSVQISRMTRTDERVQVVTETMAILRMVKLFGWESRMKGRMTNKRKQELQTIKKDKLLSLIVGNFNFVIPFLTMIAAYSTYTLIMQRALTASTVFSSMAVFELFRLELRKVLLAVPIVVKGKVSLDRLDVFLKETDLLDSFSHQTSESIRVPDGVVAGFHMASFSWAPDTSTGFTLKILPEIIFRPGINLITGQTGTGKTSMLLALLGEMRFKPLGPDSWFGLDRTIGIAYAPQESWLQNNTIRKNIVMGAPVDTERYTKVLDQCGLTTDLALFELGDLTMVGERGLTLSGGQKARITLARCIYSAANILLLDDPLAALDVHTATSIVDNCLAGDLVAGRTVVLVTHNVPIASRIAHSMIVLGSDGSIQQGPVEQLLVAAAADIPREQTAEGITTAAVPIAPKIAMTEDMAEGHVEWPAFKIYLSSLSTHPLLFWMLFVGGIALNEITLVVQAWFLGYWSTQYDHHSPSELSPSYYLSIYAVILAFAMVFYSWYFALFTFGSMRASLVIHDRLMNAIVSSTMRWLDTTPTSRIIARATQDMRTVDDSMAVGVQRVLQLTLGLAIRFSTVILFSPAFLLPGAAITFLGGVVGNLFMKAQLPIKREMSNARAPILGHLSAVIAGLASIRAYGVQDRFLQESLARIDRYTRTAITYHNLNRWIACRSDILGAVFTALLATYLVYIRKQDAATTGFVLNNAFGYSIMVLQWVRYFNTVELDGNRQVAEFNINHRILDYINVEQRQDAAKICAPPPAYWPASGHVVVDGLTARYSEDGPSVLHNISFEILSGERIGVVGRTGSGKSSLILSLLRCIITEGVVTYDGIPTDSLDLDVLRSNITIVPQVPELISGTLRYNLDPFGEYEDETLQSALRSSGLYILQEETAAGGQLTLDSVVSSGGSNLSVGQRQILALARAIVRDSKLLILDEATSAIDYATDAVIQRTLRHELKPDVSIITIAHRLQTIMDFDKIMVLEAGKLVEFDAPLALLRKDGHLRRLVDESVDKETLYAMVESK